MVFHIQGRYLEKSFIHECGVQGNTRDKKTVVICKQIVIKAMGCRTGQSHLGKEFRDNSRELIPWPHQKLELSLTVTNKGN